MIDKTYLDYWQKSQRYQALTTPQAREAYVRMGISPALERETDAKQRELLERISK